MPPVPLVPVAPVPVPVEVFEPGRRIPVSLAVPALERARPAVSPLVPVLAVPLIEPDALVPVAPVPDIDPDAPMPVSVRVPIVPLLVPVAAVPDVPTSPLLIPVLSRLLPLLQPPTASTAASASMPLPIVTLRMTLLSPRCCVVNVAALPAGGHPIRNGATRAGTGRKTEATRVVPSSV
jgi:hypothetical protein